MWKEKGNQCRAWMKKGGRGRREEGDAGGLNHGWVARLRREGQGGRRVVQSTLVVAGLRRRRRAVSRLDWGAVSRLD